MEFRMNSSQNHSVADFSALFVLLGVVVLFFVALFPFIAVTM